MSIGLGKNYLVRVVKHHYGDLSSCLEFMNKNRHLCDGHYWFELRPCPIIKKGHVASCTEYACDLLEDGK